MDALHINKVLNGDIDAFKYFVQNYKNRAFSVAFSIVKNEFDAKDIVQEAYLKAFRGLQNFKKESSFSTWFTRIVINEAFKHLKKSRNDTQETMELLDDVVPELSKVYDTIRKEEQKYFIDSAMERVPPKEALAITMYYIEENSLDEICNVTGWSASHAKVLLFRGRKSLYFELNKLLKNELKTLY